MQLVGANPSPRIMGSEKLPGITHYFLRNAPMAFGLFLPRYS